MTTRDPADPIDALSREHREALAILEALETSTRTLANSGVSPGPLAICQGAVSFLDAEIRAHNQWEEDHLFPRLEAALGPGGPCMVMRAEHRQLWDMYGALGPVLQAAREGRAGPVGLRMLATTAAAIASLLRDHIAKEDGILFPMAREVLTPKDLADLAATRPAG